MSNLKKELTLRKKELEDKLKPYYSLLKELEDVKKALKAFDDPECPGYGCYGCDICRRGPDYR